MITDQYYTPTQLSEIAKENNIPDAFYDDFISILIQEIISFHEEDSWQPEEIKKYSVKFAVDKTLKIIALKKAGHSERWITLYINSSEEHQHAFNDAYQEMCKTDPAQALEELKVHCRALGVDQYYQKHFIYLMEEGEGAARPDPDEQSSLYSKYFKEQLKKGKSEVFAHQYADLKAGKEYVEEYCYRFANAYDVAIQNGKSDKYAYIYANKIGDYYADYYGRYREDRDEDDDNNKFSERKILGYMKGWEYAIEHQLPNAGAFITCYENAYINASYPDHPVRITNEDEFDQHVLNLVLHKLKME
ncbi:hypothetical protein [Chitinophaga sp. HK235]|uniref:hypothetical protein n=1 Tax=Chitinophaga sp. HK235 TaxID=2952571 RepID=UPI001BABB44F|nr:hypothetical protein [Chitinophaga sp. HK235]